MSVFEAKQRAEQTAKFRAYTRKLRKFSNAAMGDAIMKIYAQGDLLLERVDDVGPSGTIISPDAVGALVLAEGELSGHRHVIYEPVTMFRDDALARYVPSGLYIGHVKVAGGYAIVQHQEHAPIALSAGTYRVRRQRELEGDRREHRCGLTSGL